MTAVIYYFTELEDYKTYEQSEADFHFIYNANSGGGQAFLGGRFYNEEGVLVSPESINGKKAAFAISSYDAAGNKCCVILKDDKSTYDIKPRGNGSTSMKLGVGTDRVSPSKILSSIFMLPQTCGVKTPSNLNLSVLTANNYWLQSMWLECKNSNVATDLVLLCPKDFVFCGGTNKEAESDTIRSFALDAEKRIKDIIYLASKTGAFSDAITRSIKLFADILSGTKPYNYSECERARNELLVTLAQEYPMDFSGISDPLPVLISICEKTDETISSNRTYKTLLNIDKERNRIVFGAPGTGKSFLIDKERKELLGENNEMDYERVTFHPDYSYANFVGTYKPVMDNETTCTNSDEEVDYVLSVLNDSNKSSHERIELMIEEFGGKKNPIRYEYVPGPFMRLYVKALRNARSDNPRPFLLIIEEINRANVAAVFGDIFQLLDRGEDNISEYPIQASEDLKKYLSKELGGNPDDYAKLRIPDNMFIWATMNSADQGVFPMDTAFKRRWAFSYLGIDENDEDIRGKYVVIGDKKQRVEWNELRKAINEFLANEKINEDKQLGPYFISRNIVVPSDGTDEIDSNAFCDVFKNKVLMYLFDDAAKQKRTKLFEGCSLGQNRYSQICEAFDKQGVGIFHPEIRNKLTNLVEYNE